MVSLSSSTLLNSSLLCLYHGEYHASLYGRRDVSRAQSGRDLRKLLAIKMEVGEKLEEI